MLWEEIIGCLRLEELKRNGGVVEKEKLFKTEEECFERKWKNKQRIWRLKANIMPLA